jgi:hypothetical protein
VPLNRKIRPLLRLQRDLTAGVSDGSIASDSYIDALWNVRAAPAKQWRRQPPPILLANSNREPGFRKCVRSTPKSTHTNPLLAPADPRSFCRSNDGERELRAKSLFVWVFSLVTSRLIVLLAVLATANSKVTTRRRQGSAMSALPPRADVCSALANVR